jgi:ParB family chromosome partitioning protein
MLSENIQRRQLDPMDEAAAYHKRVNEFGMTADEISKWANVSADLVKRRLALLDLLPDVQQQVKAGSLPLGHAEAMAGLDRNNQVAALRALTQADGALPTVKAFRKICGSLLEQQEQTAMFDLDALWQEKLQEAEREKASKRRAKDELADLARQRDELAAERDRIAAELAAYKEWRQLQYRAIALEKKADYPAAKSCEEQAQRAYQNWKQISQMAA